jgi:hypothetical protein
MEYCKKPQYIDMSDDIFNLNGAAAVVVEKIKASQNQQNQTGKEKPIIVLMGEDHNTPLTQIFQLAVLKECIDNDIRPAFGYEARYDFLNEPAVLQPILKANPKMEQYLSIPKNHRDIFDTDLIISATKDEPILHAQAKFCDKHSISMMFNDAARTLGRSAKHQYLVTSDALNQKTARKLGISVAEDQFSPDTQYIRNHVMTELSLDQIKRSEPDVLIHMLGDSHIFGCPDIGFPYKTSMSKFCRDAGFDVIPVITAMDPEDLPKGRSTLSNALIFEGWGYGSELGDRSLPIYKKFVDMAFRKAQLPTYYEITSQEKTFRADRFITKLKNAAAIT